MDELGDLTYLKDVFELFEQRKPTCSTWLAEWQEESAQAERLSLWVVNFANSLSSQQADDNEASA